MDILTHFNLIIPHFFKHALDDTLQIIPLLFFIFFIIEIFENFFSNKISNLLQFSKKVGPLFGALLATIPQCGFSVIATTLYIKKIISTGTLLSVYIATSDEAIPILLSYPQHFFTIFKIILIKLTLATSFGYLFDYIISLIHKPQSLSLNLYHNDPIGCCHHHINSSTLYSLMLHPFKHTLYTSIFILSILAILNYFISSFNIQHALYSTNPLLYPLLTASLGLIPSCAISVAITFLYIKHFITFGSLIAGLISNCGLGLLLLIKQNKNFNDNCLIIFSVFLLSLICGITFNYLHIH